MKARTRFLIRWRSNTLVRMTRLLKRRTMTNTGLITRATGSLTTRSRWMRTTNSGSRTGLTITHKYLKQIQTSLRKMRPSISLIRLHLSRTGHPNTSMRLSTTSSYKCSRCLRMSKMKLMRQLKVNKREISPKTRAKSTLCQQIRLNNRLRSQRIHWPTSI